VLIMIQNWQK